MNSDIEMGLNFAKNKELAFMAGNRESKNTVMSKQCDRRW